MQDTVYLEVRPLGPDDRRRWDDFVLAAEGGTFFHLSGWAQVFTEALGHDAHYAFAARAGEIEGILPLVHVRSRLFGSRVCSLPFCAYGGILAHSVQARELLERFAVATAERLGTEYLEMRNRVALHPGWQRDNLYVTFRKEISSDPQQNMMQIPRKQRAMVRKGIDAGLVGTIDDATERFYDCYSISLRNLGTPVLSRRYFRALREVFGRACEILTIEHGGRAVASVMSFYFKDEVLPYYGGGTDDARALKANDFMYWDLMRRVSGSGVRIFDFGRSKRESGSFRFKTHWGFEPETLAYEFKLLRGEKLPALNPLNPRYQLAVAAWKRLPVALTRTLGPPLARSLG